MNRMHAPIVLLAALVTGTALAKEGDQPDPTLEPLTFHEIRPRATAVVEAPELVRVDFARTELDEWPGLRLTVSVTNVSDREVTLTRLDLLDRVFGRPPAPGHTLSALTWDALGDGRCRVLPLSARRASRDWIAAAHAGRDSAVVAGFLDPVDAARGELALEATDLGLVRLSAALLFEGHVLGPNETLAAPELPELVAFFAPDGLAGLEWLFEEVAARAGGSGAAPPPAAESLAALEAALEPVVRVPAAAADAGTFPAINGFGRPLDLFANDDTPCVWRRLPPAPERVALFNWSFETGLRAFAAADLGLTGGGPFRLADLAGRDFGRYRRGVVLPLPPRSELRLVATAVAGDAAATGFEILLVDPPAPNLPAELRGVPVNEPGLAERLVGVLGRNGAILLNHRGTDTLEPLPAALDAILLPRIFPYRATHAADPHDEEEERFVERAANVEWLLDFPRQDPDAPAWLVCPEAGFLATPLQGMVADGLLAARGFCLSVAGGLVLITMNLDAEEFERLAAPLADRETRLAVVHKSGIAQNAVRAGRKPSGLPRELKQERFKSFDLVPADPAVLYQWSVLVPRATITVRSLESISGERLREEVLNLPAAMPFAIDIPPRFDRRIAVVVRRAPRPAPEEYTVCLDNTPLGPPVVPRAEGLHRWQEDVWFLDPQQLAGRGRISLSVIPKGGVLPLARIAFLSLEEKPGTPLRSLRPAAVSHAGSPPAFDRSAGGNYLRMGGEAFLSGISATPGTTLEYDLDGRFTSFLARVGIDAEVAQGGSARLLVRVDGQERFRSEPLISGEDPQPITVDVSAGRRLALEIIDQGDGKDGDHVDIVDARLID